MRQIVALQFITQHLSVQCAIERGDFGESFSLYDLICTVLGDAPVDEDLCSLRSLVEGRVDEGGADDLTGDGIAIDAGGGGVFEDVPVVVRAAEVVGHEFLVRFFVKDVEPPVEPVEEAVDWAGVERATAHGVLEVRNGSRKQ